MSQKTLNDPRARAARNDWYLYHDPNPPFAAVRAIVEVVSDETYSGDGGVTRAARRVFIGSNEVRDVPKEYWDRLALDIEEMSDPAFRQMVERGQLIRLGSCDT
jgi:hypothetical protein